MIKILNKRYAVVLLSVGIATLTTLAGEARSSYQCSSDITHSQCQFFCESEAKSIAEACAINQCEQNSAIAGGDADCEVTYSRSSSYVRSYDAVRHFLGYAVARPRR